MKNKDKIRRCFFCQNSGRFHIFGTTNENCICEKLEEQIKFRVYLLAFGS
jgi:hypothetical protein